MDLERIRIAVRHDLRSPLSVIVGRADLLLEGMADPLTPRQRHSVQAILRAAERIQDLLDEIVVHTTPDEPPDELPDELPDEG